MTMRLPLIERKKHDADMKSNAEAAPSFLRRKKAEQQQQLAAPLCYRYVVGKGNNSRLVLLALRLRPWFLPAGKKQQGRVFYWEMYRSRKRFSARTTCNHLEGNFALVSKRGLHASVKAYCDNPGVEPAEGFYPLSFHLVAGPSGARERAAFQLAFQRSREETASSPAPAIEEEEEDEEVVSRSASAGAIIKKRRRRRRAAPSEDNASNVWIVKPAAMSNRGFGIRVSTSIDEIVEIVDSEAREDADCGGWIVQKYIERPLLIRQRKFDVRVFVLVVARPELEAFVHTKANYVRTSCERYSLAASRIGDRTVHLTNDGVQNRHPNYGKFEPGNKLSLQDFLDDLVKAGKCDASWLDATLLPRIHHLVALSLRAVRDQVNHPKKRVGFELFGYDFMVDDFLKVWLIEVNSNPCMELCCPLLASTLPSLVEDVLTVGLDAVCPPPKQEKCTSRRHLEALTALEEAPPHGFLRLDLNEQAADLNKEQAAESD